MAGHWVKFWKDRYRRRVYTRAARQRKLRKQTAVLEELNRLIGSRRSTIPLGYSSRSKLMVPLQQAWAYVIRLGRRIPGPVDLNPARWQEDPLLNSVFISAEELNGVLQSSAELKNVFQRPATTRAFGLLIADWKEKVVFGAEKTGEIIHRDVARKAIFFENYRLIGLAGDLAGARLRLQHLALTALVGQAFDHITDLKQWEAELEQQQALLAFKVQTPADHNRQAAPPRTASEDEEARQTRRVLAAISRKIETIKPQIDTPDGQIAQLNQVLSKPEDYFTLQAVALKLSRLGMVLGAADNEWANQFSLAKFKIGQAPAQAAVWVRIDRDVVHAIKVLGN